MPTVILERGLRIPPQDHIPPGTFQAPKERHSRDITVQPLQRNEISEYVRLVHTGLRTLSHLRPTTEADIAKRTHEYYEEALSNSLSNGGEWTLLAARDGEGKIVGVLEGKVVVANEQKLGYVHWVGTDPDSQNQGVARTLYREYQTELEAKGIPYMLAEVHDKNEPSLAFHRKYGFILDMPYARDEEKQTGWYFKPLR